MGASPPGGQRAGLPMHLLRRVTPPSSETRDRRERGLPLLQQLPLTPRQGLTPRASWDMGMGGGRRERQQSEGVRMTEELSSRCGCGVLAPQERK